MSARAERPDLPPMPRDQRIAGVQRLVREHDADALVVTSDVNVRYLSGFTGTGALGIPAEGAPVVLTDNRYRGRVEAELAGAGVEMEVTFAGGDDLRWLGEPDRRVRLLVEAEDMTLAAAGAIEGKRPTTELMPTEALVLALRLAKDDAELARLSAAARMAAGVLAELAERLEAGMTESAVVRQAEQLLDEAGSEGPAFDILVASGPNTGSPHWSSTEREIRAHEPVLVDLGAVVDGYRSDVTRVLSVGALAGEAAEALKIATEAHRAAAARLSSTATYAAVDEQARRVIEAAGFEALHPTGHSVGLAIHERPYLTVSCPDPIGERRVLTIEPGVYVPGSLGARVENMYFVDGERATSLSQ